MSKLSRQSAGKETESRIFTVAIVLLFLAANLLLSYLAGQLGWYFYATDPMYYTLSGVTDEYFDAVNPEKEEVKLYFCMSESAMQENATYGRILDTAEQFAERYDFFSVAHLDTYFDYETLQRFAAAHDVELDEQSVVVECPQTGKSVIRSLATFYYFDETNTASDDMIFYGEEIVAALVGSVVAESRPQVLLTTGHGETPNAVLMNALFAAGYEIGIIDLTAEEIPSDTALIIAAMPKYDFEEYADKTIACELSRLRDFVASGGAFLHFRSATAGAQPRLDAFCTDYGILPLAGVLTDSTYAVDASGGALLLRYDAGEGAKAIREHALSYNTARLAAAGVGALGVKSVEYAEAVSLLRTHDTALCRVNGETVSTAPAEGYTVAALSRVSATGGKQGHVAVIAAEAFVDVDTMETDGYGNKEFLYALLSSVTGTPAPMGCGVVLLNTYPLEDMTRGTANIYLAIFGGLIPLAVAATGVAVLYRRKNRG